MKSVLSLLLVAAVGISAGPTQLAIRATQVLSASGLPDCSAFLAATYTPSAVTSTVTETAFASTAVSPTLATVTGTATDLTTTTVTGTTTVSELITQIDGQLTTVVLKRGVATSTPSVPAYASACSGAVRYSSACQCIGVSVFARTVTAATPTTTVTVTQTSSVTNTDAQTATESTTITSVTVISTKATVTSISTATTTTACVPSPTSFYLKVSGGPYNGHYLYLPGNMQLSTAQNVGYTASLSTAMVFNLDTNGNIYISDRYAATSFFLSSSSQYWSIQFMTKSTVSTTGRVLVPCSVVWPNLQCSPSNGAVTYNTIFTYPSPNVAMGIGSPSYNFPTASTVTLTVIPVSGCGAPTL
ncbi:hypothetical protein BP6252_03985 [Coleophoma cylindrospora]|uniref:Uncharacterized protein n=1 Tax=Coleophoma cylindrospora TaxID=1849047 RepID=A0A3D8S9B3_9HELO|nr:hypothetical protein BP6252_03985 [Coleophoma cylindrospora]